MWVAQITSAHRDSNRRAGTTAAFQRSRWYLRLAKVELNVFAASSAMAADEIRNGCGLCHPLTSQPGLGTVTGTTVRSSKEFGRDGSKRWLRLTNAEDRCARGKDRRLHLRRTAPPFHRNRTREPTPRTGGQARSGNLVGRAARRLLRILRRTRQRYSHGKRTH